MGVLVDSSVWIAADRKSSREYQRLKDFIYSGSEQLYTCHPIKLEVCQGARNDHEFEFLWSGMQGFANLQIEESHWIQAAQNFMLCRRHGITISTMDCLIATIASTYKVKLWSTDKIFSKTTKILALELL